LQYGGYQKTERDGYHISVYPQPLENGRGALNFHTELQQPLQLGVWKWEGEGLLACWIC